MTCPANGRKCDCTNGSIKHRDCSGLTLEILQRLSETESGTQSRFYDSALNRLQASLTK